ncbi:MAG: GNAT family N-acetyltransferase [Defluviitaleaceae bacterium]|nr:GNAT family N-acetyltransferase [Defluviitaleaceae bacterium]
MTIRKTTLADLDVVMEIYAYARAYMKESGNPNQWHDTHPPKAAIESDITAGLSYVCEDEGTITAVFYFNVEHEPTYDKIDGKWLNNEPYGVVHRIARGPGAKGVGTTCLNWCANKYPNIRIDTHKDNSAMLKLLEKLGYVYCGIIWLANGDERMAFQKCAREM